MNEQEDIHLEVRRHRSRRTKIVLSRVSHPYRWWVEPGSYGDYSEVESTPRQRLQYLLTLIYRLPKSVASHTWGYVQAHPMMCTVAFASVLFPSVLILRNERTAEWWRERYPVAAAERMIAKGDISKYDSDLLAMACQQRPDKPELFRALAKATSKLKPSLARLCLNRIRELGASTDEDYADLAIILAKMEDFAGAEAILEKASQEATKSSAIQRAWLTLGFLSGTVPVAEEALQALRKQSPDDADLYLDIAEFQEARHSPEIAAQVQGQALQALVNWMKQGRQAEVFTRVERILNMPLQTRQNRSLAAEILRNLKDLPMDQRVAGIFLSFPVRATRGENEQIRTACDKLYFQTGGLSVDSKLRVGAFLQRFGQYEQAVDLVSASESLTDPGLYRLRLDSLLYLGRWREAANMAANPEAPRATASWGLLRALTHLAKQPGSTPMASVLLDQALKEAYEEKRAVACFAIGAIAIESKDINLASNAFAYAVELAGPMTHMYDRIISAARTGGMSATEVLQLFSRLPEKAGDDEVLQEQLCYLRLLGKVQIENVLAYLTKATPQKREGAYFRLLRGLALHQQGDYTEAAENLIPLPQYSWHQGEAAVIAAITAGAGMIRQTSDLIGQINPELLFPEERAMIEPWRTQQTVKKDLLSKAE
jgi:tetratricopeptide (TPR) repeat protein